MRTVIDEYKSISLLLKLSNFVPIFEFFSHDLHQELAVYMLQNIAGMVNTAQLPPLSFK